MPAEAARAASFGNVNWGHDYIKFDGYGNLKSLSDWDAEKEIDKDAIVQDMIDNPENY